MQSVQVMCMKFQGITQRTLQSWMSFTKNIMDKQTDMAL